jgi:enterochelin esterase family protein
VWIYSATIPFPAYVEYAYLDINSGTRHRDPFNPRRSVNGIGDTNHYFYMPGCRPSPLIRGNRAIEKGQIERYVIQTKDLAVGESRPVYVYQPAGGQSDTVLVVLDGQDYLGRGRIAQIVDNLVDQGRIRPITLVLVSHGRKARIVEYACSEATLAFLRYCVFPQLHREAGLPEAEAGNASWGILGASMGGLMALFAGLRLPEIFSKVLCQSGAFGYPGYESVVEQLIQHGPKQAISIWMDVGYFERHLVDINWRTRAHLEARGYAVGYKEFPGGHNYTSWRNDLHFGLEALFPPI